LIKGSYKQIDYDTCLLSACSQILVVFDSLLKMFSIVFLLLNVKMRTNLFLKSLRYDHPRPICDGTADKSDHAGPTGGTPRRFEETDAYVESSPHASLCSESVFDRPGVRLQVVQYGVKCKFTFTHGHKETFDGRVVSLVQGVR
jgi:hypothetical protein